MNVLIAPLLGEHPDLIGWEFLLELEGCPGKGDTFNLYSESLELGDGMELVESEWVVSKVEWSDDRPGPWIGLEFREGGVSVNDGPLIRLNAPLSPTWRSGLR